ncbi:MAG: hypothetical protein J6M05_00555 [Cardiobacteriaceae bacterium]|nr:hypothetical protein [Cardiobacteriaceae bacterium]
MYYKQIAIFYRECCCFAAVVYQLVRQIMKFFLRIEYRLRRDFSPTAQNDGCGEIFRLTAQNDGRTGFFACGSK